ncbi:MAG: prephenate dehydrogenase dimerization domain-containing protein, partial [Promethearchaeota archaeon]
SSVKGRIPDVLKGFIVNRVQPLCIHPMFGPGSRTQIKKILLLPIFDAESEQDVVTTLFPNAQIILTTQEEHDRAMALTISLPYLVNMALASVYVEEDIALLQQMGGTTFTMQLLLTSSVMSNDSCLHKSMHTTNEHSIRILSKFQSTFRKSLMTLTRDVDEFVESYRALQGNLGHKVDLNEKYHEMYHILEAMGKISTEEVGR